MNWTSTGEFFAMGGYALYVWGAYGVTAALIGLEAWMAARRRRRALIALRAVEPIPRNLARAQA